MYTGRTLAFRISVLFLGFIAALVISPPFFSSFGGPVTEAFSVGRFGWPGLEWREIADWWTSGYSRGVVIGRNYIPPCKLCDMPRMFRVDK